MSDCVETEKRYVDCSECGAHEELHWIKSVEDELVARNLCFSCNHWVSLEKIKDSPKVARVGNIHYMIEKDQPHPMAMKGHGGAKFVVKFNDGREVVSRNVWCQGRIPDRFKERLPDNACFQQT